MVLDDSLPNRCLYYIGGCSLYTLFIKCFYYEEILDLIGCFPLHLLDRSQKGFTDGTFRSFDGHDIENNGVRKYCI